MKKLMTSILIVTMLALLFACDKPEEAIDQAQVELEEEERYQSAEAGEDYVIINAETYTEKADVVVPNRAEYADDKAYADAVKQAAYELYLMANRNDQNCLRRLAYTHNTVTTVGVEARNLVISLKNGDEYLKYDFQPDVKKLGITVDGHAKATYARLGLEKAYYVEVRDCVIDDDWTGYANFGDAEGTLTTDTDRLYFHASQKQLYLATDAIIDLDTIQNATLEHNDAEGYYRLVLELDASSTGAARYLVPLLRKNSGMIKAKYTSITETIEIWDNGFFKRFLSVDKWSSSVISSTINYDTAYYYDEASCDLTKYSNNYYATIKALAEAANAAETDE